MKRDEFLKRLTALAEILNHSITKGVALAYWEDFQHYPDEALDRAFRAARMEEFFPKPGKLMMLIEGDPKEKAASVWALVDRARCNSRANHQWNDPAIPQAIEMCGGLIAMGQRQEFDPALEKEFKANYVLAALQLLGRKELTFDNPCQMIAQCSRAPEGEPHGN